MWRLTPVEFNKLDRWPCPLICFCNRGNLFCTKHINACLLFFFRIPSLQPKSDNALPRFYSPRKPYGRIHSTSEPTISIATDLRHNKISFWNEKVPHLFYERLSHYQDDVIRYKERQLDPHLFSYRNDKSTWILTSACIGLSVLTVVLTIGYYKMRKEVTRLLRQNSVSSGERMLPSKVDL